MKLPQVRLELLRLTSDVLLTQRRLRLTPLALKGLVCVSLIPGISDLGSARIQARTTYAEGGDFFFSSKHQNRHAAHLLEGYFAPLHQDVRFVSASCCCCLTPPEGPDRRFQATGSRFSIPAGGR